jgi:hypothetical protein
MTRVLAIDPGNIESAYALIDAETRRPIEVAKLPNEEVLERLMELCVGNDATDFRPTVGHIAIEMVASYGMPVGREVFETCVWIGRFQQLADIYADEVPCDLIVRKDVKMHHCHSNAAKDSNIAQALIDRFASGEPNRGKGTKAQPGWFYGFAADIWAAYALAVLVADVMTGANV